MTSLTGARRNERLMSARLDELLAKLTLRDTEIAVLRSELKERYEGAAHKAKPVGPKRLVISCQNDEDFPNQ